MDITYHSEQIRFPCLIKNLLDEVGVDRNVCSLSPCIGIARLATDNVSHTLLLCHVCDDRERWGSASFLSRYFLFYSCRGPSVCRSSKKTRNLIFILPLPLKKNCLQHVFFESVRLMCLHYQFNT